MVEKSAIEWTDSSWNPVTGCTKVSRGCDNCYAHSLAHVRLREVYTRQLPVIDTTENRVDPFAVRVWPDRLSQPTKWREPRMIFVNSMSDVFHADIPEPFLRSIFESMVAADHHIYQVLTKRPSRVIRFFDKNRDLFPDGTFPWNIWIGTSIEDQATTFRARHLKAIPAVTRFLSCEPLLGPLDLDMDGLQWVIAGGESGIGFRAPDPDWVRGVRDQCVSAGVPFFFKQWGGRTPKARGRELDDRVWDEFPERALVGV